MNTPMSSAETLSVGGSPSDSNVSLCIYSPEIDLAAITKLLGCSPTTAYVKGDLPNKIKGSGAGRVLASPEIITA